MDTKRDYLTVGEAAKLLDVSRQTIRNWIDAGRLEAQRDYPENGQWVWRVCREAVEHKLAAKGEQTRERLPAHDMDRVRQDVAEVLGKMHERYTSELGSTREELGLERGRRERLEAELERERGRADGLAAKLEEGSPGFWARLFGAGP